MQRNRQFDRNTGTVTVDRRWAFDKPHSVTDIHTFAKNSKTSFKSTPVNHWTQCMWPVSNESFYKVYYLLNYVFMIHTESVAEYKS